MVISCFLNSMYKIGFAEDIHRLVPNRKLLLGGIHIPFELGEDAHSDGDVLLHAISESLLGALALGDLGKLFPDTSKETEGMDSKIILDKVISLVRSKGYDISNIDTSIILERPKLAPHIEDIRQSISNILNIDIEKVSVKANTNEGLGPIGEGKAIKAISIVLLNKIS